ncbi:MAG: hypothetical protein ABH831_00605 [Candidatus Nealsonbacteria bacterium]
MKESMKQKLPLIIGVGLPLILVLWIVVFVYVLPSIFVNPTYSFIYATSYDARYIRVVDEKVKIDPCPYSPDERMMDCSNYYLRDLEFYLYDMEGKENIPLTLEEVEKYNLDSSEKSPDGYLVSSNTERSGDFYFFPFFWGSSPSRGFYIGKDGGVSKQLSLKGDYYNFKFLGWVVE